MILFLILIIIILLLVITCMYKSKYTESFDGVSMFFNGTPEWFRKQKYSIDDWYVPYFPDQLAYPGGCDTNYRGDPGILNWESSAYRFWRM